MRSQIESVTNVEMRVRVEIPWAEVAPRLQGKLRELRSTARLPGFRPGKVPPQMIERLFGRSVRDELARDLVSETFQTAVSQHGRVALTQGVMESAALVDGEDFKYAARFEVAPALEPKDYVDVPVRRRKARVADDAVDAEIERMRQELTELHAIEADPARTKTQDGDVWTIDIDGTIGEQRVSGREVRVDIGGDKDWLPGLSAALADLPLDAVGTTRDVRFVPDPARIKPELRNLEAVLTVALRDVREKRVPALDDAFARDTGRAETMEELRKVVHKDLEERDGLDAERAARQSLIATLLERNPFDAAPSMLDAEISAQVESIRRSYARQGVTLAQLGMTPQSLAERIRPQATFAVKGFLLLDAIGKKESISVTDAELDEELEAMAAEQGTQVARLRATLGKDNQLLVINAQLREAKILDFLMGKAKIEEYEDDVATAAAGEGSAEPSSEGSAAPNSPAAP